MRMIWMASSSNEKFGQAWGSFIIAIRSLQSVPKCWQFECWSMLSNVHFNASNSECSVVSRLLKFRIPISWIFSVLSFYTQPIPLNRSVDIQEPSTMHILFKLKACITSVFGAWGGLGIEFLSHNQRVKELHKYTSRAYSIRHTHTQRLRLIQTQFYTSLRLHRQIWKWLSLLI